VQLNQITANIRLRNPWEAIDLGFALVRHFARDLYLPWFIFLACLSALIFILFPDEYQSYAFFVVWWLKPLYDRFLLNILSQKLFNEPLSTTQALKALPYLIKKTGLLSALTFRRPSFSRGFIIPVWQLEQLRGKERAERQRTLLHSAHSHAIALTLGMIFIESAIYFSFIAILMAFIPQGMTDHSLIGLLFSDDPPEEVALWLNILDYVLLTTALFLIEPFYVAASFSLYLNRRTQLEAWDIELVFKQISKRLAETAKGGKLLLSAVLPALLLLASLTQSSPLLAADTSSEVIPDTEYLAPERLPAEKSKEVIKQVMQRSELSNEKKVHNWVEIEKEEKKEDEDTSPGIFYIIRKFFKPVVKLISVLFESSLWAALGIGILFLFLSRKHWLHLFSLSQKELPQHDIPEVLFGMDIRPQSLPDNIPEAARALWRKQKHREALSLLYRGALAQMANRDQIPLKSSQTEGDILKLTRQKLPEIRHQYLQQLTQQWKQIAYAHHLPADEKINFLLDHWDSQWLAESLSGEEPSESGKESSVAGGKQ